MINKSMKKIFISHSSKDIKYVKAFNEQILRLGLGINSNDIFCSSIEGQGIKSGSYIPDTIRDEIRKSCLAFLFISSNYKESEICLNELGAAWVYLEKKQVIPILLPDVDFDDLGFLDKNRLSIKINNKSNIINLIDDINQLITCDIKHNVIATKVEEFLETIKGFNNEHDIVDLKVDDSILNKDRNFTYYFYEFNNILRKATPTLDDDLIQITNENTKDKILNDLNKLDYLNNYWIRFSRGDIHVDRIVKIENGNWLFDNWEIKIGEFWICKDSNLQNEFILFKSEALTPYQIQSDIAGEGLCVGVLNDGTYISEIEYNNNYTVINGETIELDDTVEFKYRKDVAMWIFIASPYHKIGYNGDPVIKFCILLDKGLQEVNYDNIYGYLGGLPNNPTVSIWM